ncbi:hypothetical protein RSAG8_09990, partial [Rhizoctonia solani AG-8 WAC10335]
VASLTHLLLPTLLGFCARRSPDYDDSLTPKPNTLTTLPPTSPYPRPIEVRTRFVHDSTISDTCFSIFRDDIF